MVDGWFVEACIPNLVIGFQISYFYFTLLPISVWPMLRVEWQKT